MERFVTMENGISRFDVDGFLKAVDEAQDKAEKLGLERRDMEEFEMKELGFTSKVKYREKLNESYNQVRLFRYGRIKSMLKEGKRYPEAAKELGISEQLARAIVRNEDYKKAEDFIKKYGEVYKKARDAGLSEIDFTDFAVKEFGYETKVEYLKDFHRSVKLHDEYVPNRINRLKNAGYPIEQIVKVTGYDEKLVRSIVEGKKED